MELGARAWFSQSKGLEAVEQLVIERLSDLAIEKLGGRVCYWCGRARYEVELSSLIGLGMPRLVCRIGGVTVGPQHAAVSVQRAFLSVRAEPDQESSFRRGADASTRGACAPHAICAWCR